MSEPINIQDLIDGRLDIQSLGEAANGDENTTVVTRTGETYPSAKKAINAGITKLFEAGGLPAKPFPTLAKMQTEGASLADGSYAMVADGGADNGLYVKTAGSWVKTAYDPVTQAKNYVDGYATVKSKTIPDGTNFNALTEDGIYKVSSNASALTMTNCPSIRAGVLEVLAISSNNTVQRYTPYGIENKVYIRASNTNVFPSTWDEVLLKSNADATYATQAAISTASSATISAVTQSDYYGKKYSKAELDGSALYSNGFYVGYNSITTNAATFNAINARVFNPTSGKVEYRIYTGSKVIAGANGYQVAVQSVINNPDFSGICQSFPASDAGTAQNIFLDKAVTIPANTPFVIIFKAVDSTKFSIAYAPAVTGNLENRSYNLSQISGDWSAQTAFGNAAPSLGYVQAGFKLLVVIPNSGNGGDADKYKPYLVLPPKIYVLANLQAHIYPEHLTPEPRDLYLHDVTCLRGKQTIRGWEYDVPTSQAAGNITLSWALHDKQTGEALNTASTTLVVAPQTTSGNKNVLVIGDSYVNAGTITQRLLDISATDALKTTLIGTRGTAPNKHEGRGGWKVSDYATVGRNDYKFTVAGVTTAPAINSTTYSYDGRTYLVQEVSLSGGSGYIVASLYGGAAPTTFGSSGTLTKANTGVGDTTVTFSNIVGVSANPFWINSEINFGQYLTNNSLSVPDIVLIQLGVNDSFGITTDNDVVTLTTAAFAQLDTLIASIKAANPSVKVGIVAPPTYANQDAFGISYACNQTAWRAKRNIVVWNRELYARFKDKEAQNTYVVAAGINVDTQANFPTTTQPTNSHNSTVITVQNNGVHPATSGYNQIGDAMFAWIKAVS